MALCFNSPKVATMELASWKSREGKKIVFINRGGIIDGILSLLDPHISIRNSIL